MPPRARKTPLKIVTEDSRARRPKKALTVLQAIESGDYLAELVAMRRRIASDIDNPNTPARDLAALSRRQLEISKEINAIRSAEKVDDIGEAAATPDEEWIAT